MATVKRRDGFIVFSQKDNALHHAMIREQIFEPMFKESQKKSSPQPCCSDLDNLPNERSFGHQSLTWH